MIRSCKNAHKPVHRKTKVDLGLKTIKNWRNDDRKRRSLRRNISEPETKPVFSTGKSITKLGDLM